MRAPGRGRAANRAAAIGGSSVDNGGSLAAMVSVAAVLTGPVAYFTRNVFARGLEVGALAVGTLGDLAVMVMMTGTMATNMGAVAEHWTASELRPLRKARWRILNHVSLREWDIDHVLVGPGGVVAVETKWSSRGWTLDPVEPRVVSAIARIQNSAKDLRWWGPLKRLGVDAVVPVVFLWGSGPDGERPYDPLPKTVNGVTVIGGVDAARAWRDSIRSAPDLRDAAHVHSLWQVIEEQVRRRDQHEAASHPVPPTLFQVYWTFAAAVLASFGSFLLAGQSFGLGPWIWTTCLVAIGAAGITARRVRALRIPADGWLAGLAAALILIAIGALHVWLS